MHYDGVGVRLHPCMCKWCVCVNTCMHSCTFVCACVCVFYLGSVLHLLKISERKAKVVGKRKQMTHEVNITDLEYADDMALVSSSWDNLTAMIAVLNQYCPSHTQPILPSSWLRTSCKKTKILVVRPTPACLQPETVALHDDDTPTDVVDMFQYLGSTVFDYT